MVDKSTADTPVITISTDNGKGIFLQIMPKLFEKFTTNSDSETGLVLYITKNLVEAHGGRIWSYNNKDGIGATFIFSLPRFDTSKNNTTRKE